VPDAEDAGAAHSVEPFQHGIALLVDELLQSGYLARDERGHVKLANSAIANFSLCSRSACGALNTRAPSRTAAEEAKY